MKAESKRPVCLDLTRSVRRLGRGPATGIDRVERAYLDYILRDQGLVPHGLIRTRTGFVLLDRGGLIRLADHLDRTNQSSQRDVLSKVTLRRDPRRAANETLARSLSAQRCPLWALERCLRQWFPAGADYFNVGHANIETRVLNAWQILDGARINVFVHDTIPLDLPDFQRDGIPEAFLRKIKTAIRHADRLIVPSDSVAADIRRHFVSHPPITVASLGVRAVEVETPQINLPRPYFLSIGTIEPRKNHALLLDIWKDLGVRENAPHLVLAGARGWKNTRVFAVLDALKAGVASITEINDATDAQIDALLRGATALLHPSRAEGFGLPVFEALAAGCPVIASPLPVFKECLGEAVIYADPDTPYQWSEAINRLLTENSENSRGRQQPGIPAWPEHFSKVFSSKP